MVEFLGDLLGGRAAESRGETGVSIPALTGDWSALTERKSLAPVLGGWMTDMSPTKGKLRVFQHQFDQLKEEMVAKVSTILPCHHHTTHDTFSKPIPRPSSHATHARIYAPYMRIYEYICTDMKNI